MRTVRVVVLDVLVEHAVSRWRRPRMSVRSRHSRRNVAMTRSRTKFARGARIGVLITLVSSAAKTASKEEVNFVSRSRMRNLTRFAGQLPVCAENSVLPAHAANRFLWMSPHRRGAVVQSGVVDKAAERRSCMELGRRLG